MSRDLGGYTHWAGDSKGLAARPEPGITIYSRLGAKIRLPRTKVAITGTL
jgi:hypothetical protein